MSVTEIRTRFWDPAEHLETEEDIATVLKVVHALGLRFHVDVTDVTRS